ncbi:MAG: hypothetical protein J7L51_02430 [Desulfurococcales archaeon]|nr:hypothetical protein [Desulfurococcales archaeon]
MSGEQEVVNAEAYIGGEDLEAEAKALLKAVKMKKELKEKGKYVKRWGKDTVEMLANIAKVLWESEERNGVIEVTYSKDGKTIKEIEIKSKDVV